MDYDLTGLGWRDFEHMTGALFERFLGVRVTHFGDGPDGGREATFRGSTKQLAEDSVDWNGYVLLQAKFKNRPQSTTVDQNWLIGQVEAELREWDSLTSARRQAGDIPDYLVIASNVHLTPAAGGGIDRLDRIVSALAPKVGIKGWLIWDRDKISRMLDNSADIRRAYASLITPGDVLAKLHDLLEGQAANIGNDLRSFANHTLIHQRHVRLTESGGSGNLTLEQVGVDLPCSSIDASEHRRVIRALVDAGDLDLRPSSPDRPDPTYLIMGGPGQGKSTVSNILAQLYRVALLKDDPNANKQVQSIIEESLEWIGRQGLPMPRKRRWPLRVDLAEVPMGEALLKTITTAIKKRLGYQIPAPALFEFMTQWPWILILDGLDEVASAAARESIHESVSGFLAQAAANGCDLLTIITTRPQGYDHEFDVPGIATVDLLPLNKVNAFAYANSFAAAHFREDDEERNRVLDALSDSADDENVARLLESPLQVTIMTLLLADRGHAPRDRYLLFDFYYETIYKREAAKKRTVSADLNDFRNEIHALHEQVGLELQRASEESGRFDAYLDETDLQALVMAQLVEAGHTEAEATPLAERLAQVAAQRLVLLVPKASHGIGFEVRSLQEYMAARALTSGPEEKVLQRLGTVAPAAHWRNAWLLAMGRLLRDRPHLQRQLLDIVRTANADPLARRVGLSIELACALTMDGIGATRPAVRQELLDIIVGAFLLPPLPFEVHPALDALAAERAVLKASIMNQLKRIRSAQAPDTVATARSLLAPLSQNSVALGVAARDVLSRVSSEPSHQLALDHVRGRTPIDTVGCSRATLGAFADDPTALVSSEGQNEASRYYREVGEVPVWTTSADPKVVLGSAAKRALEVTYPRTPDVRLAIAISLEAVEPSSWVSTVLIGDALWRALRRQPVADDLELGWALPSATE